jgi:hypothetical protein
MAEASSHDLFTRYVQTMSLPGEDPDRDLFDSVWRRLKALLVAELRVRGLWTRPPRYLGVLDGASWAEPATLEELTAQCYSFVFVDRLRAIIGHVRMNRTIEALVHVSLRNFVHEKQKENDPIGFKVFRVLRAALESAAAEKQLFLIGGSGRLSSDSIIATNPDGDGRWPSEHELRTEVLGWADVLLPDLVTTRGRGTQRLVQRLHLQLVQLGERGDVVLRFRSLIEPLKAEVRGRWRSMLELEGRPALRNGSEPCDTILDRLLSVEGAQQGFDRLVELTTEQLQNLRVSSRTRSYCVALWRYLVGHAQDTDPGKLPSDRKLSAALGIPRGRIRELYGILEAAVAVAQSSRRSERMGHRGQGRDGNQDEG